MARAYDINRLGIIVGVIVVAPVGAVLGYQSGSQGMSTRGAEVVYGLTAASSWTLMGAGLGAVGGALVASVVKAMIRAWTNRSDL